MVFNDTIGDAIRKACIQDHDSEALHLDRAAKIVRRDMFSTQQSFKGTFEIDSPKKSLPPSVLALVSMIIEGPSIKKDNKEIEEDKVKKAALTISQLLSLTAASREEQEKLCAIAEKDNVRYPYTQLGKFTVKRERGLVDVMHKLGLCVSDDRVNRIVLSAF